MLSDSKEHPPSSPLPTNERSGSAVKCRDTRALTHKHFYSGLLAYFSTRVQALCLHVCMGGVGGGWNCRRGALMAACFSGVSPGICLHPSSVFNARLHNQSSCRSFLEESAAGSSGLHLPCPCVATRMSPRRRTCTESTFLFLCTKNGTARAPRIAECCLVSPGR